MITDMSNILVHVPHEGISFDDFFSQYKRFSLKLDQVLLADKEQNKR